MPASLTPAALAKAKALGVVAAALTAGGAGGMVALSALSSNGPTRVVVTADATTSPTADPTATPTETPTPTATPTQTDAPAPAGTFVLPSCPADVKNHGAYVSSVAKAAPKGRDGEHGSWVSQAAKSDCGKTPGAQDSQDSQDSPEPDASDSPESHSPKPVKTATEHSGSHHGGHGDH